MIESFWSHHAVLYRPRPETDPSTRDESGDVLAIFDPLTAPTGLNCCPHRNWSGTLQNHGPGEQQNSLRQWFLDKGFPAPQERDVLRVESGPESPVLLRLLSVVPVTMPVRLNHYEVNVEVFVGSVLPEAVTS